MLYVLAKMLTQLPERTTKANIVFCIINCSVVTCPERLRLQQVISK